MLKIKHCLDTGAGQVLQNIYSVVIASVQRRMIYFRDKPFEEPVRNIDFIGFPASGVPSVLIEPEAPTEYPFLEIVLHDRSLLDLD